MEDLPAAVPLGATGRVQAQPMTNASGNHALLVREGEAPRALLTAEPGSAEPGSAEAGSGERQRIVVIPLDDEVELRVDGDAMAVWLSQGSIGRPRAAVPAWANLLGYLLVIAAVGFAVLGSVTFFGWLFGVLGWA